MTTEMLGSVVYIVQANLTRQIKIGHTVDLTHRLSSLRSMSGCEIDVLLTVPGGRPQERHLHAQLLEHRQIGEWYAPSNAVLDLIEKLRIAGPGYFPEHLGAKRKKASDWANKLVRDAILYTAGPRVVGERRATLVSRAAKELGISQSRVFELSYGRAEVRVDEFMAVVDAAARNCTDEKLLTRMAERLEPIATACRQRLDVIAKW